ncbi:MAG: DinB family protein [Armatimonadota bacterium]|nr:DinB family protein [Armatimonadota bacterium]MDR5697148.1 DinB family protein [Armatimonadota bacterium]
MSPESARIAERVARAYTRAHGLAAVLEGATATEAGWRPVSGQPTIAEIVGEVVDRCAWLTRALAPPAHLAGPPLPTGPLTAQAWEELRTELARAFAACAEAVRGTDVSRWDEPVPGRPDRTWRELVDDLVVDAAHGAGQITVLRRWYATQDLAV